MRQAFLEERGRLTAEARTFFSSRGYLEVETPIAVPSPGLDVHLDAFELIGPPGERALSPPRYLSTSPEYQMKRLLADGCRRIYQITRAFRAGEIGARHNPEFTIVEFYRPGGMEEVLRDTEQLAARLTGGAVSTAGQTIAVRPPLLRLSVVEAFERWASIAPRATLALAEEDETEFFRLLIERVEPGLALLNEAVFLIDYPASQASLARKKASDLRVAERFELYVGGVELCNGFGELNDPVEQRARLLADQDTRLRLGKPVYPIDERFVESLVSMPPSGGNALGFDRLVALVCGATSIGDVMTFPEGRL